MIPVIDVRQTGRWGDRLDAHRKERMESSVRAMNRAVASARTEAVRLLRPEYPGLKASAIRSRIKIVRATRQRATAALEFSGRRIKLFGNFGMRSAGRGKFGVRFTRLPWRVETIDGDRVIPEMLARAFRQRARSSGRASVFARHTGQRDSFEVLLAPGIARAVTERGIAPKLSEVARRRYIVVFDQEMKFRLKR